MTMFHSGRFRHLLLLALAGGFGIVRAASGAVLELKLTGGIGRYLGKDLTSHLEGWNALATDQGLSPESRLGFTRRGLDFEGQIILNATRFLGFGIGVGTFRADEDSRLTWTNAGVKNEIRDRFKADVMPLTAFFVLHIPLGSRMRLNLSGGAGYHLCKIDWQEVRNTVNDAWNAEKKGALGYQGALSLDVELVSRIALVLEAYGRSLKLEEVTGKRAFKGQITEGVRIWLGKDGGYDMLAFLPDMPLTDADHSGWREAAIDLSGYGLRAGLNIRF